jgi:hypothetical protein
MATLRGIQRGEPGLKQNNGRPVKLFDQNSGDFACRASVAAGSNPTNFATKTCRRRFLLGDVWAKVVDGTAN